MLRTLTGNPAASTDSILGVHFYGSEHQSLAVLEVRVHIPMTSPYKSFAFDFDEAMMQTFPL
jgi:hypothetical protein